MKISYLGIGFIVLVLLLSGCAQSPPTGNATNNTNNENNDAIESGDNSDTTDATEDDATNDSLEGDSVEDTDDAIQEELTVGNFTVSITDTGYDPQTVTIKKGSTVTWTNNSTAGNWPATAQHPTHTVYPGSGIEKCGTEEEANIFDACRAIQPGETYSFTFNEVGEWGYHEHSVFKMFGKIIVVE